MFTSFHEKGTIEHTIMRITIRRFICYVTVVAGIFILLVNWTNHNKELRTTPELGRATLSLSTSVYPRDLLLKDRWSGVDANDSAYVYTAYYQPNKAKTIQVIAAVSILRKKYHCALWYYKERNTDDVNDVKDTLARVVPIHPSERRYVAARILCPLSDHRVPGSVTIFSKDTRTLMNLLPVTIIQTGMYIYNFTVCPAPINLHYNRAYELVEFIELNRILGADKFIFYNYSISSNVNHVLNEYSKRGLVEVIPWQLPMRVNTWPPSAESPEIHYFGQLAQLNDCLLRTKSVSRYLVILDLDEFIIPHSSTCKTWFDIIDKFPGDATYYFKNVFFRKEWGTGVSFLGKKEAESLRLVKLLKTLREVKIHPVNDRSKYITRTELCC